MATTKNLLETDDLSKKFGGLTAVKNLNLGIKREEIFGFLGPNGAGKTTAIRMMVGLLEPTSGRVKSPEIDNLDSEDTLGICPQDLVLWDQLTCRENLKFMGRMYDVSGEVLEKRAERLLKMLNLLEKKESRARSLSGGMKRKLNVAMSLMHEPKVVILDEPSAGLDPRSRASLWDFIQSLRSEEGKTIILTTHLMEEADKLSDRVGIMDRGEMLVVDSPQRLKKRVGKGDSITLKLQEPDNNKEALATLREMDDTIEAQMLEGKLIVRALDAIGKVPKYTEKLGKEGFVISDISVSRTNTLEDVFIHLTGRKLE